MRLLEYRKKRSLKKSTEPAGGRSGDTILRFVVQKHDASHLHYDFRLEMDGVLKSWAIPKGPSLDPKQKRLAVAVEDHPYDYRTFEGVIPEGNYGAGAVMVWDEGTYTLAESNSLGKKEQNVELQKQLKKGKVHIVLDGEKLKGEFVLVKAAWKGDKNWLLMKLKDEFASKEDILDDDASAVSGRSMEEIQGGKTAARKKKSPAVKRKSDRLIRKATKKATATTDEKKAKIPSATAILRKATASKFMTSLSPMLATLVDQPFDKPGWQYEIKWDGYRALAFMKDDIVHLKSRNDKSFDEKFYPVQRALLKRGLDCILDGEIVVLKPNGVSNFGSLQNWRSEADGDLVYYVFDILWFNGKDLTELTLSERKQVLKKVIKPDGIIRISDSFETAGSEFYATARRMGLEGIIAKKSDSTYQPGARTADWLKIKANQRQEVVIGGYTHNLDSAKPFSALLVGVFEKGRFVYTGKIGTGFKDLQQREMLRQFEPYVTKQSAFSTLPDYNKPSRFNPRPSKATVVWMRPELVCEVSYTEMTSDGVMRHPSFEGMRIDKNAKYVHTDIPKDTNEVVENLRDVEKIITPHEKRDRSTLLNPKDETQVRTIEGHEIKFTNLSKIYWPAAKSGAKVPVAKRDMLNYYYQVAPYILTYLEDRPQSLNRFPNGINGKSFYQKDVTGKVPDWVDTYLYHSSDEPKLDKHYLVPRTEADVLLMASLGCIEMNPWSSRTESPDNPDWCIIDLDPDTNTFDKVIEAALVTRDILSGLKIESYCKTSGSTGLHIYIPLAAKYSYEESKEFARAVVTLVNKEIPKFTSIERIVSKRKGKIYLDFLQNRPQATVAAPYSLRPKPGAPVSMPLHWDEVKKGLKLTDFNISNAIPRLRDIGDIFKPVLGKGAVLNVFK